MRKKIYIAIHISIYIYIYTYIYVYISATVPTGTSGVSLMLCTMFHGS